jgi:hypothetical protein
VFERFIEEILALLPPEVLAKPAIAPATWPHGRLTSATRAAPQGGGDGMGPRSE